MRLPFSEKQFFAVFQDYNTAVWPAQIILIALAVLSLIFLAKHKHSPVIAGILSFFWAWMAIVYHLLFFSRINPLAKYFSALYLIQSGLLLWHGVIKRSAQFDRASIGSRFVGSILVSYSLIIYPVLNMVFGHPYPANPTFGVPCPTTIFTIGLLLFLPVRFPKHIFVVPICWSVIGTSAAFFLRVPEDLGLGVAGFVALIKILPSQNNG